MRWSFPAGHLAAITYRTVYINRRVGRSYNVRSAYAPSRMSEDQWSSLDWSPISVKQEPEDAFVFSPASPFRGTAQDPIVLDESPQQGCTSSQYRIPSPRLVYCICCCGSMMVASLRAY